MTGKKMKEEERRGINVRNCKLKKIRQPFGISTDIALLINLLKTKINLNYSI
jgi:hypothetical protein